MPRRPQHLQLRGNVWWLRVRVPDQIQGIIGKIEVRRSLGTSDAAEAKRRVRIERVKVEAEFDDARYRLAVQDDQAVSGARSVALTEEQVWALATRWFVNQEKANAERLLEEVDEDLIEARYDGLDHVQRWDDVSSAVSEEVQKLLAEAGLPYPTGVEASAPWLARLSRAVNEGMVEGERRLFNRTIGRPSENLNPAFQALSAATILKPVAISTVTLTNLIERYERDPTRARPSPKTKLKQDAQHRLFKQLVGAETLVSAIDREQARKLLDTITALPANASKLFPNRTPIEVLRLSQGRELKRVSVTTANSYMSAFVTLMDFAVKEHLIDRNPAAGLRLASDGVRRKDKRLPFSPSDLARIFTAPLYTGCLNDQAGYARPGPERPRRGRFWVPLISLFSGMRLNEVCQLGEEDILREDDTDIIRIRSVDDGQKRVKTEAGHRSVPIHPELRRLGFLDYVAEIRAAHPPHTRLFPELSMASTGYISDNFSKWFANFLDKVGIDDTRKNFHSFRHTFRDALREAEIPQDRVRELGGWSSGSTEDDYGSGTRLSTLAREIDKICYHGLDLSSLHSRR